MSLDFNIENLPGAEFRAELNQYLAYLRDQVPLKTDVEQAISALQSGKLGVDDQAKDAAKLGGRDPSGYALAVHSHKADDLPAGGINTPGILEVEESVTSNRTDKAAAPKSVAQAYKRGDDAYKLADSAHKLADAAYPQSGGSVTGTYNYAPETGIVITFGGKTVLERHTKNGGLSFGADDGVVIGSGEARGLTVQNVSMSSEILHLSSDTTVIVRSNLQSGWAARKEFVFEDDGGFKPANVAKTQKNLGVRPAVVGEIVEFGFDESDMPPGYFIMNNTRVTNGMLEPAYKEFRDKCLGKFITQSGNDFIVIDMPDFRRGKGSSSREIGEFQSDAIRNISGYFYGGGSSSQSRGIVGLVTSGSFYSYSSANGWFESNSSNKGSKVGFSASRQVPTASENRSKSRTVLVCIYHGVGV